MGWWGGGGGGGWVAGHLAEGDFRQARDLRARARIGAKTQRGSVRKRSANRCENATASLLGANIYIIYLKRIEQLQSTANVGLRCDKVATEV